MMKDTIGKSYLKDMFLLLIFYNCSHCREKKDRNNAQLWGLERWLSDKELSCSATGPG